MAIVQFGVTVTGLRGTVGGGTFSANKAGPYLKAWARSANPRSTLQTAQRNRIALWAQSWQALSAAQKTAWDAYAAAAPQELTNSLGEPYYVSGFNWYVRLNTHLQEAGDSPISAAPVLATPAAPLLTSFTFKATGAASNTRVGFNAGSPTLTMKKALFLSVANSTGRQVRPTIPRLIRIVAPSGTQITFQAQLETVFGTIQAKMRGFIFVYNQNSEGRRSAPAALVDDADTP